MNKYFIGHAVPSHIVTVLIGIQAQVVAGRFTKPDQMHITSLFLGEVPQDKAEHVFRSVSVVYDPIKVHLEALKRFGRGDHLVVTLGGETDILCEINTDLQNHAGGSSKYKLNPHVTIARELVSVVNARVPTDGSWGRPMPEVEFEINQLVLYEKPEGGEYSALMVRDFTETKCPVIECDNCGLSGRWRTTTCGVCVKAKKAKRTPPPERIF